MSRSTCVICIVCIVYKSYLSFSSYIISPFSSTFLPTLSLSLPIIVYGIVGYFSSTGFTPGCEACPIGTSTSLPGMAVCDICDEGYFGRDGEPPCTGCPKASVSNDDRTGCYLCVGYEPGCSLSGESSDSGGDSTDSNWMNTATVLSSSISVLTDQFEHLDRKVRAQQSYIERYNKQRNQA